MIFNTQYSYYSLQPIGYTIGFHIKKLQKIKSIGAVDTMDILHNVKLFLFINSVNRYYLLKFFNVPIQESL